MGIVSAVLRKFMGTRNERVLKLMWPVVEEINSFEPKMQAFSDEELKACTPRLREKARQIEKEGGSLDEILPEAFAVVREAGRRTIDHRHFDVQLIGAIVLHQGKIAEMVTGEGKTLVATAPIYLNALTGKGAHVVTVNDYLARRDTEWMGQIYQFLGMEVGFIQHDMEDSERRKSYAADITYGTNNEFGFDYLRDNMKYEKGAFVQRGHHYAIVDEVDSILIDEARTPLIISGSTDDTTDKYTVADRVIPGLKKERDYVIDEKARTITLTDDGVERAERSLGVSNLFDPAHIDLNHHVNQSLKAHKLFKRDVDYVVEEDEVVIVDEFTGRKMAGRRFSDGLHQALEAKERVSIATESQTLASITFQNYFRMYDKLAGMTGTALTEAEEFMHIYKLDVISIPTNMPLVRDEYHDVIYKTAGEKFNAVVDEIEKQNKAGRPVLVGTISIENSETLSRMLQKRKIKHNVLNAKHHEQEAEIIAQAGQSGAVTIATNMAGRGTDIVLGAEVPGLDGLHILGTERHESRRIDNQLRGRAGRQGDPGSSQFFLSLEDDLLRIFGGDRIKGVMERLGAEDGVPIQATLVSRAIENAQKRVEEQNFSIRKHLLEYDDVMNRQREVIYEIRNRILSGVDIHSDIIGMIDEVVDGIIEDFTDEKKYPEEWDYDSITNVYDNVFGIVSAFPDEAREDFTQEILREKLADAARAKLEKIRETMNDDDKADRLERFFYQERLDSLWKDHLLGMDFMKEGVGLRGYAQKDPLVEYKREGLEMFQRLIYQIKEETIKYIFHVKISSETDLDMPKREEQDVQLHRGDMGPQRKKPTRKKKKIYPNDPCPCGSNKKYKKCCGRK